MATIDGVPDAVTPGQLAWETVDGPQGGLSIVHTTATDITGFTSTSYYLDDSTPRRHRHPGDWRRKGERPVGQPPDPNTDPRSTPSNRLMSTRTIYYEQPGKANGAARTAQVASAFGVTVSAWP